MKDTLVSESELSIHINYFPELAEIILKGNFRTLQLDEKSFLVIENVKVFVDKSPCDSDGLRVAAYDERTKPRKQLASRTK